MGTYDNTKWGKTRFLNLHDDIRRYIPETKKATKSAVSDMLRRYGMVYVKPSLGTGGHGVMRAEAVEKGDKLRTDTSSTNDRTSMGTTTIFTAP